MLIKRKQKDNMEICWYNSSNVPKSIYYPEKDTLMVYFIRERKSKDPKSEAQDKKKILLENKQSYLIGAIYSMAKIDGKIYEAFRDSSSQGNFWNTSIVKNPNYFPNGDIEMFASEIKDVLKEREDIEKGFDF